MLIKLPDEVVMDVPVEHMAIKDSIFIPTLKPTETRGVIREVGKELGIKLVFATKIVDGYFGVEFWRVDGLK